MPLAVMVTHVLKVCFLIVFAHAVLAKDCLRPKGGSALQVNAQNSSEYDATTDSFKSGARFDVSCVEGYYQDSKTIECEDGEFVPPIPRCEVKAEQAHCTMLPQSRLGLNFSDSGYDDIVYSLSDYSVLASQTFKIRCQFGYVLVGAQEVICDSLGKWEIETLTQMPYCLKQYCDIPVKENMIVTSTIGEIRFNRVIQPATLTFKCVEKYDLKGSPTGVCNSGAISYHTAEKPYCEAMYCNLLKTYNDYTEVSVNPIEDYEKDKNRVRDGAIVIYRCKNQTRHRGPKAVKCIRYDLTNTDDPDCSKFCWLISLENLKVMTDPPNMYKDDTRSVFVRPEAPTDVIFSCQDNYELRHGSKSMKCYHGVGVWSGETPMCFNPNVTTQNCTIPSTEHLQTETIDDSEEPIPIIYEGSNDTKWIRSPSRVKYSCYNSDKPLEAVYLAGVAFGECQENGAWSPPPPTCTTASQFQLQFAVENGMSVIHMAPLVLATTLLISLFQPVLYFC